MGRIARILGAKRRLLTRNPRSGYFGALQLTAEVGETGEKDVGLCPTSEA